MPYLAGKTINLAGTTYQRGVGIPEKVFLDIPHYRQGALLRTKLVLEVESVPRPGDPCPHCENGPFVRLAQHISLKHPDIEE